jgi:hypothetical protein
MHGLHVFHAFAILDTCCKREECRTHVQVELACSFFRLF